MPGRVRLGIRAVSAPESSQALAQLPKCGQSPSMEKQTAMLSVILVGQKCCCCPGEREGSAEAVDPKGEKLRRAHTTATNSSTYILLSLFLFMYIGIVTNSHTAATWWSV